MDAWGLVLAGVTPQHPNTALLLESYLLYNVHYKILTPSICTSKMLWTHFRTEQKRVFDQDLHYYTFSPDNFFLYLILAFHR